MHGLNARIARLRGLARPLLEPPRMMQSLLVLALASASAFAQPREFVSTKATASRLGGLPGRPCAPADAARVKGPCWDPPGHERAIPMATLQAGKRVVQAPNWKERGPKATYWFDIPREATLGDEGAPLLPTGDGGSTLYLPYDAQGFVRPALPPLVGRPVDEIIAALDALDMPFALYVQYGECKKAAHDHVCDLRGTVDGGAVTLRVNVAQKILYRGTPDEERFRPEADQLENRPTEEVVAELRRIGFTKIEIVEMDLPCKRGIVCRVPGHGGFQRTDSPQLLWVRKAE